MSDCEVIVEDKEYVDAMDVEVIDGDDWYIESAIKHTHLKSEDSGIVLSNILNSTTNGDDDMAAGGDKESSDPGTFNAMDKKFSSDESFSSDCTPSPTTTTSRELNKRKRKGSDSGEIQSPDGDDEADVTSQDQTNDTERGGATETDQYEVVKRCKNHEEQQAEFIRGMTCDEPGKALEIIRTSYRLSNVGKRHSKCTSWMQSSIPAPTSLPESNTPRVRPQSTLDPATTSLYYGAVQLREIRKKIELRDREIKEMLRKILEADACESFPTESAPNKENQAPIPEVQLPVPVPSVETKPQGITQTKDSDKIEIASEEPAKPVLRKKKRGNPFRNAYQAIRRRLTA